MDTTHRKIELQSPADLNYLIANAKRTARAKIDLHFPPSAAPESGEPDAMKARVEELVNDYIQNLFTQTHANLAINGLENSDLAASLAAADAAHPAAPEELEPYDTRLASRIQNTAAQVEALTLQLANLRRTAPAKAASAYVERTANEASFADERMQELTVGALEAAREQGARTGAEGLDAETMAALEGRWERGVGTLAMVGERTGYTAARVDKARRAVEVLEEKVKVGV